MKRAARAERRHVEMSIARRRIYSSLSSGAQRLQFFQDGTDPVFHFYVCCDQLGVQVAKDRLRRLDRKEQACRTREGLNVAFVFFVQKVCRTGNSRRLLPAHRKKGAQSCLGAGVSSGGIM